MIIPLAIDLRDLDYINWLEHLGLWTMKERRNRVEVLKLCKGHHFHWNVSFS